VSEGQRENFYELVEYVKLSKKVLYHFGTIPKFAIVNELLIIEYHHISARSRIALARRRPIAAAPDMTLVALAVNFGAQPKHQIKF